MGVNEKPRILPVVWLFLAVVAMAALHGLGSEKHYLPSPWNWLGLAPAILGTWMAAISARAFTKAETGLLPFDDATALVTGGFYRFTRNPMYLGMVLALAGLAIVLACLPVWLPVIGFALVIHHVFILREERFMEQVFGEAYVSYTQRVRRWL